VSLSSSPAVLPTFVSPPPPPSSSPFDRVCFRFEVGFVRLGSIVKVVLGKKEGRKGVLFEGDGMA